MSRLRRRSCRICQSNILPCHHRPMTMAFGQDTHQLFLSNISDCDRECPEAADFATIAGSGSEASSATEAADATAMSAGLLSNVNRAMFTNSKMHDSGNSL